MKPYQLCTVVFFILYIGVFHKNVFGQLTGQMKAANTAYVLATSGPIVFAEDGLQAPTKNMFVFSFWAVFPLFADFPLCRRFYSSRILCRVVSHGGRIYAAPLHVKMEMMWHISPGKIYGMARRFWVRSEIGTHGWDAFRVLLQTKGCLAVAYHEAAIVWFIQNKSRPCWSKTSRNPTPDLFNNQTYPEELSLTEYTATSFYPGDTQPYSRYHCR